MKKYFNKGNVKLEEAVTSKNWNFPVFNRYAFSNINEFQKTRTVYKGTKAIQKLNYGTQIDLNQYKVTDHENNEMTMLEYLKAVNTDGFIVYKNNEIISETYDGYYQENQKHIMMSATKSITGILLVKAVKEGLVNYEDIVSDIVTDLKGTAFDKVTVKQALDMQMVLDFSENYADLTADIWEYAIAMGWLPEPKDYDGARDIRSALKKIQLKNGNKQFLYTTPITDICNWVLTEVKGKNLTEIVQEEIYQKLGMEQDAEYGIDLIGNEIASGSFIVSLRDALRIGKLMLNKGKYDGEQVLPAEIFEDILTGGDDYIEAYSHSLQAKQPGKENWYYKNQVWVMNTEDEDYAFIGVYGQVVYVNNKKNIVIVKQGSNDEASTPLLGYQISMIQQLVNQL